MSPSAVATLALVLLVLALYWVPSIIASARKHPDLVTVVVVNALLGWTFGGWLYALRRAVRAGDRAPAVGDRASAEARGLEPRMGVNPSRISSLLP
jgi:Superinfection immunity protein